MQIPQLIHDLRKLVSSVVHSSFLGSWIDDSQEPSFRFPQASLALQQATAGKRQQAARSPRPAAEERFRSQVIHDLHESAVGFV